MQHSRTFQINGTTVTFSSHDPEVGPFHLALLQILWEMGAERGTDTFAFTFEEIAQRLVAKGFGPETGKPTN